MNHERLQDLISQFPSRRIAVVGDFFLDKYMEIDPSLAEISLETGKIANQVVNVRHSPGAAGNVVSNLASLGARDVITIGFTGDDGEGYDLRKDLAGLGCSTDYLFNVPDRRTPTYLKPMDASLEGLDAERERYDTKNRAALPGDVENRVIEALRSVISEVDAIIAIDQVEEDNCGVITDSVRTSVRDLGAYHPDVIFWADSRCRIGKFQHVTIKPNQFEAVKAAFPGQDLPVDEDAVLRAGAVLRERTGRDLFLTRSESGIMVFTRDSHVSVRGLMVDGPIDPTGAGDSVTAASVLSLASGARPEEAALIANLVGSIVVQQIGVTGTARVEQLGARLDTWLSQPSS